MIACELTQHHKVLRDPVPQLRPVEGDVLVALLDQGSNPDAEVHGHDVGQPEPGHELELVDVQLEI